MTSPSTGRAGGDTLAGALFAAVGAAAAWTGWTYPLGTATEMGPGYYPVMLGGVLLLCGAWMVGAGVMRAGGPAARPSVRAAVAVAGAATCFALLAEPGGLAVAAFVAAVVACAARPGFLRPSTFVLAAVLAGLCVAVFIEVLGIPLPLLPAWKG